MWQGPGHSGCHAEWRPCTLSGQTGGLGGAGQGCETPVETHPPGRGSVCGCGEGGKESRVKEERRKGEGGKEGRKEREGRRGRKGGEEREGRKGREKEGRKEYKLAFVSYIQCTCNS